MSSKALNRLYDLSIFLLVVSFLLVVPTPIFVNDDTFVYFNYARNFAEGRPFAYDPRNIPSEGFTSMLYMLLLVPAEVLRINPVFASSAINILALALSIVWLGQMVRTTGILPSHLAALFTWLLTVFTLSDQNIRELVFAGFESIVGLLCVTGIVVSVAYVLDEQRSAQARRRWMSVFLVAAFLAHLVRPEYLMVGAIGGAVLLWRSPDRGALLRRTAIFAFVIVVYYLFKFVVFGDLFPTGFYRKVRSSELGIAYVTGWVRDYFFCLLAAYFLVRHIPILRKNLVWTAVLGSASVSILLFYTQTTPLVYFFYRFLIVPTWSAYIVASVGLALLIHSLISYFTSAHRAILLSRITYFVGLAIFCVLTVIHLLMQDYRSLYERAEQGVQSHFYIQLATHWRTKLSDPSTVTVVFGDAGVIPYALRSRFVDANGLTEPSIAHLFRLPDGEEKNRLFIRNVLVNQPDVILDYNWSASSDLQEQENGLATMPAPVNNHSPFNGQMPAAIYQAYRDYGMVYGCSIHLFVKLHVLIRRDSPVGAETLKEAFCSHPSAYYFPEGLLVRAEGQAIHFPPLTDATAVNRP